MQSSSEQPLVGEERYVTTLITAAKETIADSDGSPFEQKNVHLLKDVSTWFSPSRYWISRRNCIHIRLAVDCKNAMFVDMCKFVHKLQCFWSEFILIPWEFFHLKTKRH